MPIDYKTYPKDWKQIALRVKNEASWRCEHCGKTCIRPGELSADMNASTRAKFTLTVSHRNHIHQDCRRENLWALCAPCHMKYDAEHHKKNAAETRARKKREARERCLIV